jgi:hypothetical protein
LIAAEGYLYGKIAIDSLGDRDDEMKCLKAHRSRDDEKDIFIFLQHGEKSAPTAHSAAKRETTTIKREYKN